MEGHGKERIYDNDVLKAERAFKNCLSNGINDQKQEITRYTAKKIATVTIINGQNARKKVPPRLSRTLPRGIKP